MDRQTCPFRGAFFADAVSGGTPKTGAMSAAFSVQLCRHDRLPIWQAGRRLQVFSGVRRIVPVRAESEPSEAAAVEKEASGENREADHG